MTSPTVHQIWVHSSAVQIAYPERVRKLDRRSSHTGIYPAEASGNDNWILVSIPVPSTISGGDVWLAAVMVELYVPGSSNILILQVQVMDGRTAVATHDVLPDSTPQELERIELQRKHRVRRGICILVRYIVQDISGGVGRIEFYGAGCEYRAP